MYGPTVIAKMNIDPNMDRIILVLLAEISPPANFVTMITPKSAIPSGLIMAAIPHNKADRENLEVF